MSKFGVSDIEQLKPWRLSDSFLGSKRTVGETLIKKNCDYIDVWMRIDGTPRWFGIRKDDLEEFLASDADKIMLEAQSNDNAE